VRFPFSLSSQPRVFLDLMLVPTGLYLCEYTFFTSLASAQLANPASPTPVQFVHVPPIDEPYSLLQLTQAIRLMVWAIVNEGLPK
jgi:pyroglutamyl-peptidase